MLPRSSMGEQAHVAIRHHQAGRLNEAVIAYQAAIGLSPDWPDLQFNLGIAFWQQGRMEAAARCFQTTVELQADYQNAHYNLGLIHWHLGRLDEAVTWYRQAVLLRPDHLAAILNLGIALREQGRLDEAAAFYHVALEQHPDSPEANFNLGIVLCKQGKPEQAAACYQKAIELRRDYWKAYINLGAALQAEGRIEDAVRLYRQALDLQPDNAELCNNLGAALQRQGRLDEAAAQCERSIGLKPGFPDPFYNLGVIYRQQGRLAEAVTAYRHALGLKPDYPDAWSNLGVVLQKLARMDEAAACHRRAIDLRPDSPEAFSNLGVVLYLQRRMDEAARCLRQAIALRPHYAEAHLNLASVLMRQGEMAEGWAEYEWRFGVPDTAERRRTFVQPQWRGEAAAGRTILIHAEQGLGDTLQFCRYAVLAKARGLLVVLEVQKPLARLLRCLDADLVIAGDELPPFDLHCPMLSMPLAVGTVLETIPSSGPYLRADPVQVDRWAGRLAAMAGRGTRIGLVWAGSTAHKDNNERSLDPARLAPLFGLPGLHFVSLQKGGPAAPDGFRLLDFMAEMHDLADTAALIMNLDLVISVDTAVAHLAAALGKPVWMLDRFDPDWRWPLEGRGTPWYPTLRIYRQPTRGDWDPAVAAIVDDLRRGSPPS